MYTSVRLTALPRDPCERRSVSVVDGAGLAGAAEPLGLGEP